MDGRKGTIVKHFHSKVSKHDIAMFSLKGTCDDQQVLECLAILVAIRAWMPSSKQRVQLAPRIRGDNIGALTTVIKMRPKTPRMAIIAEEIAVHLVHYSFPPAVYHTPGLAHVVADQLSRINDPSKPEAIKVLEHPALERSELTTVEERPPSYYKALSTPNLA